VHIRELSIQGSWEITPNLHRDNRGVFLEWFRADRFTEMTGHPFDLLQANCSVSAAGTIRGIHFAELPPSQAKYVACPSGAILDVVVDIRVGSPTYGQWDAVQVDDERRNAVYLAEGLGHAFMALSDNAVVNYLCSAPYAPGREHGLHPLDPAIGIDWPTRGRSGGRLTPVLSPKDSAAPGLEAARTAGLLSTYEEVQTFLATPRQSS
jgi:dTDP-4-dehydrorhamnose 3,5-epimerase